MKEFFGILTLKGIVENQVKEKNFASWFLELIIYMEERLLLSFS